MAEQPPKIQYPRATNSLLSVSKRSHNKSTPGRIRMTANKQTGAGILPPIPINDRLRVSVASGSIRSTESNIRSSGRPCFAPLHLVLLSIVVISFVPFALIALNHSSDSDSGWAIADSLFNRPPRDGGRNDRSDMSQGNVEREAFGVPAYVVSLILCSSESGTVGFLDAAAVFRHSVHKNSVHNPHSGGKYSYKMYAIVHSQCAHHASVLEKVGYHTLVRDTPIDRNQIKNDFYRKSVESENCCGSAEFIKMFSYQLLDHPVVVHFDLDKVILKPLDDLFDAMLFDVESAVGKAARSRLDLEFPNEALPDRIDAFFTRDYTSNWPWKKIAGVQGGFLVLRPDKAAFDEYIEIILAGNFTPGFNNEAGWDGLGFGGFQGGKAFQGIVPYFYDHRHPGTAVELNVCRWNQVAADVIWRGPRGKEHIGECRRYPRDGNHSANHNCEDCRVTPVEKVWTLHYTACKKPWACPVARTNNRDRKQRHRIDTELTHIDTCMAMHREWFRLRKELDDLLFETTGDKAILGSRGGEFKPEYFLGYCDEEGKYRPLVLPEASVSNLYQVSDVATSLSIVDSEHASPRVQVSGALKDRLENAPEGTEDKTGNRLRRQMKAKLLSLHVPKWPQLNHATAEAVSNGIILGPPVNQQHLCTIVSAYYEFRSKHAVNEYETWFPRLLGSSDPLIIFVEPESNWLEFIVERRSHAPTIVVPRPFDDLVMSTTFAESFWKEQFDLDPEKKVHRGTGVYKIWNEKLVFMLTAAQLNPYNSEFFSWMDAGYFRRNRNIDQHPSVFKNNIAKAGVDNSKMLFLHIRDDDVVTAGNAFAGSSRAVLSVYENYYQTFWNMAVKKLFVGSDQKVMAVACRTFPSSCHLHFPGKFRDWFAFARIVSDPDFDLSEESPRFHPSLELKENYLAALPEGVVTTNVI